MHGHKEVLTAKAVHFHQVVRVPRAVKDQQAKVVVGVELGALAEMLGIFESERVEMEGVLQYLLLRASRGCAEQVQPERGGGGEQALDLSGGQLQLLAVQRDQVAVHYRKTL